jgi:hypothetical protein
MLLKPFGVTNRNMETKAALYAAVHEVLDKDNYEDWSVRVQTYLMVQDLWVIVNGTTEHPKLEDDEATIKVWSKKNTMALHVIQISCGSDAFSKIRKITSAKDAWDTLEGKYVPKNTGIFLPLLSMECTCLNIINVK